MRGFSKGASAPTTQPQSTGRTRGVLSLLGALVAASVALGLVVAGVLIPLTGFAGAGVKKGVDFFDKMPSDFSTGALSQSSRILAADGSVIATPFDQNRIVVTSDQIPTVMKNAQVAIEDQRFYQHGALDDRGLLRAIGANVFSSSGTQGASTLTQQYVKVASESEALNSGDTSAAAKAVAQSGMDGYARKIKQLKYAVELEKTHTKDQILTGYLNIVYFGDQQYGIEAASRHYFGHPAKDLTLAEAATLAGVVNLPGSTDPIHNPAAAKTRRNIVLQKMAAQGLVSRTAADAAIASPLVTHVTQFSSGCLASKYPYYCQYVTDYLSTLPALGKDTKERLGRLKTGGLTIQTAMQPKMMATLDQQVKKYVPFNNSANVQAAGVIVQPGSGLVQAMGQNSTYDLAGTDMFHTSLNYDMRGFPIGSTAKLFAISTAMENGHNASSTINVPKMTGMDSGGAYAPFTSKNMSGPCGQTKGVWKVHNDEPEPSGNMSYSTATAKSVNTAFAQLVADLGACKVRDEFGKFGVRGYNLGTGDWQTISSNPSAIVLGADSSSPLMMANAYATIAAQGKYCPVRPVVSITDASGKNLDMQVPGCKQILTQDQARNVAKVFKAPLTADGTGHNAALADGRDAFGKTGTVSDSKHTWFVGSTVQEAAAIWVGRAGTGPEIRNVTIGGTSIGGFLYGGDIAAPLWKGVMDDISKGMKLEKFPDPVAPKQPAAAKKPADAKKNSASASPSSSTKKK